MIDFIYETLSGLGFDHPLHPIAVHIPMGMIVGGFLFGLLGLKMEQLTRTAHYCFSLALFSLSLQLLQASWIGSTGWSGIGARLLLPN